MAKTPEALAAVGEEGGKSSDIVRSTRSSSRNTRALYLALNIHPLKRGSFRTFEKWPSLAAEEEDRVTPIL